MPTLLPDQIVEKKYRIVRLVASGGQGAVYEVMRDDIGQRGALKVLTLQATPAMVQRFINEARAVNAIRHPNIPQVSDMGTFGDGVPWMVMEFLEGDSLEARLMAAWHRPERSLSMEETLAIAADMASALEAAHQKGIVHRDLKPSNVIMVTDSSTMLGERAMVLDFGVAKLHEDHVTQTGAQVGTPIYMSPEQIEDASKADAKADVYSLGLMLYQMLCGRLPFPYKRERGHWALMLAKANPPRPIEKYAPHLPAELRELIMRMVQKDRTQRPTMAEVQAVARRMQGLPPPRQTGSHDALLAPPLRPTGPTDDDDDDDPTGDVSSSMIEPRTPGPTPSEQARGEISPQPPVAVPKSLSEMPSVPVVAPMLRAGPEESTERPAPTQLVPDAVATPSSPTVSDKSQQPVPPRSSPFRWIGPLLAISGVVSASVFFWPPHPAPMVSNSLVEPAPKAPAPTLPPPEPSPAAAPVPVAPSLLPAPTPSSGKSSEHSGKTEKAASASARPSSRSCEPIVPEEACIITNMNRHQRDGLISNFRKSGVKFCRGERMILSGFPRSPEITTAPASLKTESAPVYSLIGYLVGVNLPAQVELRCPAR